MHYVIGSKKGFFGFDNESFYKKCYLKEALTLKVICLGHFKISTKANVFKTYNTLDKRVYLQKNTKLTLPFPFFNRTMINRAIASPSIKFN